MSETLPYGTTHDKEVERVNGDEFVYKFVEHSDSWRGIIDVHDLLDGIESGDVVDSDDDVNLDMLSDTEYDDSLVAYVHRDELMGWVKDEFSDIVDEHSYSSDDHPIPGDVYSFNSGLAVFLEESDGIYHWLALDDDLEDAKGGGSPSSYGVGWAGDDSEFVFPQRPSSPDFTGRHVPLDKQ